MRAIYIEERQGMCTWFKTICLEKSRPAKAMLMIMPAAVMMPPVWYTPAITPQWTQSGYSH